MQGNTFLRLYPKRLYASKAMGKGGGMNMFLLFISGLIFLTCFYGQSQLYSVNWFLVFGMVFSSVVITWIMGEA